MTNGQFLPSFRAGLSCFSLFISYIPISIHSAQCSFEEVSWLRFNRHKNQTIQDYSFWKHRYSLKLCVLIGSLEYWSSAVSGTCSLLVVCDIFPTPTTSFSILNSLISTLWWVGLSGHPSTTHLPAYPPLPAGRGRKWEEQGSEKLGVKIKTGKSLSSSCCG